MYTYKCNIINIEEESTIYLFEQSEKLTKIKFYSPKWIRNILSPIKV